MPGCPGGPGLPVGPGSPVSPGKPLGAGGNYLVHINVFPVYFTYCIENREHQTSFKTCSIKIFLFHVNIWSISQIVWICLNSPPSPSSPGNPLGPGGPSCPLNFPGSPGTDLDSFHQVQVLMYEIMREIGLCFICLSIPIRIVNKPICCRFTFYSRFFFWEDIYFYIFYPENTFISLTHP